eukprot:scpid69575/ scgid26071/ 
MVRDSSWDSPGDQQFSTTEAMALSYVLQPITMSYGSPLDQAVTKQCAPGHYTAWYTALTTPPTPHGPHTSYTARHTTLPTHFIYSLAHRTAHTLHTQPGTQGALESKLIPSAG